MPCRPPAHARWARLRSAVGAAAALCAVLAISPPAVSADVHVSTSGLDTNACTEAAPCKTFDRAYRVAAPGEVVWVAGGSHGNQTLRADAAKAGATARVTFRPAADASVGVGKVRVEGEGVEFRDMTMSEWYAAPGSRNVVFRDITVNGGIFITSASQISMIGGSVGPGVNFSPEIKAAAGSTVPPRDILIDGVLFHDWTRSDPAAHVDCLHIFSGEGLTVRNSRFRNCEAFAILFTLMGSAGSPRDVLIENNFFDCCRSGYYSVSLGNTPGAVYRNFLIRFNSANKNFSVGSGSTVSDSNIRFDSNIAPSVNPILCTMPGVTWSYNVWGSGSGCSGTDRVAGSNFLGRFALDYHLVPDAGARGAGNPSSFPETDIDGHPRPALVAPDAGADQWFAAEPPPPPDSDPPPPPDSDPPPPPDSDPPDSGTPEDPIVPPPPDQGRPDPTPDSLGPGSSSDPLGSEGKKSGTPPSTGTGHPSGSSGTPGETGRSDGPGASGTTDTTPPGDSPGASSTSSSGTGSTGTGPPMRGAGRAPQAVLPRIVSSRVPLRSRKVGVKLRCPVSAKRDCVGYVHVRPRRSKPDAGRRWRVVVKRGQTVLRWFSVSARMRRVLAEDTLILLAVGRQQDVAGARWRSGRIVVGAGARSSRARESRRMRYAARALSAAVRKKGMAAAVLRV